VKTGRLIRTVWTGGLAELGDDAEDGAHDGVLELQSVGLDAGHRLTTRTDAVAAEDRQPQRVGRLELTEERDLHHLRVHVLRLGLDEQHRADDVVELLSEACASNEGHGLPVLSSVPRTARTKRETGPVMVPSSRSSRFAAYVLGASCAR
jgi:hypothetical protein